MADSDSPLPAGIDMRGPPVPSSTVRKILDPHHPFHLQSMNTCKLDKADLVMTNRRCWVQFLVGRVTVASALAPTALALAPAALAFRPFLPSPCDTEICLKPEKRDLYLRGVD